MPDGCFNWAGTRAKAEVAVSDTEILLVGTVSCTTGVRDPQPSRDGLNRRKPKARSRSKPRLKFGPQNLPGAVEAGFHRFGGGAQDGSGLGLGKLLPFTKHNGFPQFPG